jgi:hypothetical protein
MACYCDKIKPIDIIVKKWGGFFRYFGEVFAIFEEIENFALHPLSSEVRKYPRRLQAAWEYHHDGFQYDPEVLDLLS